MVSPSSSVRRERARTDREGQGLQDKIDSLLLDGQINDAKVENLANEIHTRLGINTPGDGSIMRTLAEQYLRMRLNGKGGENSGGGSNEFSSRKRSNSNYKESPIEEVPTASWSQESSSPEQFSDPEFPPERQRRQQAGAFMPSPTPPTTHTRRSPTRTFSNKENNRGRSPARSSNPNIQRSRTPVSRFLRRGSATPEKQTPVTATTTNRTRRRSRSNSFRGLFGRSSGSNYEGLPSESPAAASTTVYYDSHANMESVLGGTPTPQRRSRLDMPSPNTARRPPLDPNVSMGTEMPTSQVSSSGFGSPPLSTKIPLAATAPVAPLDISNLCEGIRNISLDEIQFNIGTSKPPGGSPTAMKSPSSRSRRSAGRRSFGAAKSPKAATPGGP